MKLPVWVTEERIAALYVLGRHDEMEAAAQALPFQTRRSRIYRAVVYERAGRHEDARKLIAALRADDPEITSDYIRFEELYRDDGIIEDMIAVAERASLPQPLESVL